MRRTLTISALLLILLPSFSQTPVGSWSDHLVYNTVKNIAVGSTEVYASTGSSLIVYNKIYTELRKMSRIDGLTEAGISTIAWSEEYKTLIIGYSSTNIDLVKSNIIYNVPDIDRKYIPGNKEIYRIRTNGKFAFLASSFGIAVLDINKREIYDTWKPRNGSSGSDVWDVAFGNGKIYAATSSGVYSADLSNQGLAYFGNWDLMTNLPVPYGKYTSLVFSGGKLYANLSVPYSGGDSVYALDEGSSPFLSLKGIFNTSFDPASDGFTITSPGMVKYYNSDGSIKKTITSFGNLTGTPKISQAVVDNGEIWIADINSGLLRGENMSVFFITGATRSGV